MASVTSLSAGNNDALMLLCEGMRGRGYCIWRLRRETHCAIPRQGPGGRRPPAGRRQGMAVRMTGHFFRHQVKPMLSSHLHPVTSCRWSSLLMKWSGLASRVQCPSGSSTATPPTPRGCTASWPRWRTTLASSRRRTTTRRSSFTTGRRSSSLALLWAVHRSINQYLTCWYLSLQWDVWRPGQPGAGWHCGIHTS